MNPREIATQIVADVIDNQAYANISLTKALRKNKLDDRDRRFCTELTYGTIKAGKSLDWFLNQLIKNRTLEEIPKKIRSILRVGLYQLLFMSKVPHSAAVNESTNIAKKVGHIGLVKFVNGVLRNATRTIESAETFDKIVDEKIPDHNSAEYIAIKYFHPHWLVEHWIKSYGINETVNLCKFNNQDAPLCLRVNTLKNSKHEVMKLLTAEGIHFTESTIATDGLIITDHQSLDDFQLIQDGTLIVQDESSQLVATVLNPQVNETILDACAAPGGKSTHIAALIHNHGKIVAVDSNEKRVKLLQQNIEKSAATCIETLLSDARDLKNSYAETFDKVLVDAPCSGLGILRRKPDSRWKKKLENLQNLPKLQIQILENCSACVKKNGVIVYSTCTIEKTENDDIVAEFLTRCPEFELESKKNLFPTIDNTDGFFIARMKRVN